MDDKESLNEPLLPNKKYYNGNERNIKYTQKNNLVKDDKLYPKFNSNKGSVNNPINTLKYGNSFGPGKGNGNPEVNNMIRNGEFSRLSNQEFNKDKETQIGGIRDILIKNPQKVDNIVLPFPRGGESTRKSVELNDDIKNKKFEFRY
tara:strand:+ start:3787 stop:4227 length:441 start_codon:yes stop_codon:yes gene_type:complete